jgi:hypothetical protein
VGALADEGKKSALNEVQCASLEVGEVEVDLAEEAFVLAYPRFPR